MYKLDEDGKLNVSGRGLPFLYELPIGIRVLYCSRNELTSLSELPDSLVEIMCSSNNIKSIDRLPNGLKQLVCHSNKLKYLPEIPDSLVILMCHNNPLECLIPWKFVSQQSYTWLETYYYPYINSYRYANSRREYKGQKNILSRNPSEYPKGIAQQYAELAYQAVIHPRIKKEFSYLIEGCDLGLV